LLPVMTVATRSPGRSCPRMAAIPAAPAGSGSTPKRGQGKTHGVEQGGVVDKHDVVHELAYPLNRFRDRGADGDTVSDGVDRCGGDRRAGPPAVGHSSGAGGADTDDVAAGQACFQPARDAGDERAVTDRKNDGVHRLGAAELDADGAGTLADLGVLAVLDKPAVGPARGVCPRGELGLLDVDAADPDHRAEGAHPVQLGRVDVLGDEHLRGHAACSRGVGDGLAEVAGRGAHQRQALLQAVNQELSPAALEAAQRVERLDLDKHPPAQCRRHIVVNELRAVPEHRGDDPGGPLDAVDGKIHSPSLIARRSHAGHDPTGRPGKRNPSRIGRRTVKAPACPDRARHGR
jgi:hypothetical protein